MIVFFDEAHALPTKMMTGGLLNAMEPDDGLMVVKQGRTSTVVVDCKNLCWVGATTEKGKLFDAFANRLGTDIEWRSASSKIVAKIVAQKMMSRYLDGEIMDVVPDEACALAARYRRVPREAINFAVKMAQQQSMFPSDTWEEAADQVAQDMGLDEWGFSEKQIAILSAVGQRPMAEKRLALVAKCRSEQVERYELPMLMDYTNGGPLVVPIPGRGMCITHAGLRELEKRGIAHRGEKITAEHFESRS
jgi:Holliday junction resolvasome RuvABC ATP-dependent DNA helicase subunit